ncbi:MAG: hypothetical protein GEU73_10410 [Chloroflexi bacterium]|nr:hypothetical protein [Chloroflexota bacterium]
MKKRLLALIATLTAVAATLGGAGLAQATHGGTGNGAPNGSHYTLNIIGVPKDKTAEMKDSSRHTIFVPLWGSCAISLVVGPFQVNDGNCTDRDGAEFQLPNPDPDGDGTTVYSVFARALGTPGGSSKTTTCATDPDDGSLVCSVISLELKRDAGQTQFQNASKYLLYIYWDGKRVSLFDPALEDYFWQYDNNGLKLAQLRFYDCSTVVPPADDPKGPQDDTDCFSGSH